MDSENEEEGREGLDQGQWAWRRCERCRLFPLAAHNLGCGNAALPPPPHHLSVLEREFLNSGILALGIHKP